MAYQEFTGKTVEEAITEATVALGVTSSEITYEVVDKGSSGLFGLGSKEAVIKACIKGEEPDEEEVKGSDGSSDVSSDSGSAEAETSETDEVSVSGASASSSSDAAAKKPVAPVNEEEVIACATKFLDDVFKAMELEVEIKCEFDSSENFLNIDLSGPEMGIIIGKRGQTLDSVQYLTNLAVNRTADSYVRVKIDTEDYRRRRKETLENFAHNTAHKVKKTRRPVVLEAMNPYERRVIHAALANNEFVETHSEGEEPYRHVVVTLKR